MTKESLQNWIKGIQNAAAAWIIEWISSNPIAWLRSLQTILLKKFLWKKSVLNLAPKILTGNALESIKPYLNSTEMALEDKDIKNIALTGAYGSGKSSILRTFQHHNPQHKYLNICLASFNHEEQDSNSYEKASLEQLEASILQQIIYHVKSSEIPASRFKKNINIGFWKSLFILFGIGIWTVSLLELSRHRYLVNSFTWNTLQAMIKAMIKETPFPLIFFLLGLLIMAPKIFTLLANLKISKVGVKEGAIEFSENIEQSILNKHIDEILYFFEKTQYNVVIIEDLDRFENTQIFTKLREINTLINNYKAINRKISFLYVIKDELLQNKSHRVKFFDLIIPVIPFIDPHNAGEQLKKLRSEKNLLEEDLPDRFLEDISRYIDDIDMRLLINIFHEYLIYKEILQKNKLNQTELFAIVTYKNLFPSDFANLHKRKGKLYEFFSKKGDYIQENLNEKKNQITNLRERIKEIDKEKISDIEELRMIYVQKLVNRLFQQNNQGNYIQTTFWVENTNINFHNVTNNDQDFTRLLNAGTVQTQMNNGSRLSSSFTNQEKEEYIARGSLIKGKADNEVNEHKQEIEKLNKEINEIKLEKIKDIFKSPDVDQHIHEDLRKPLIRYLITKGYINENYHDYISLFHAVTMSRTDDAFLRHIKSLSSLEFSYRLDRVNEIIKRIEEDYFQTEIVLNFDLLDALLSSVPNTDYKKKRDFFLDTLAKDSDNTRAFVKKYVERSLESNSECLNTFINLLCKKHHKFWTHVTESDLSDEKKQIYLELILKFTDLEDIKALNDEENHLVDYISTLEEFPELASKLNSQDKIESLLVELEIKFKSLKAPDEATKDLFNFIYEKNLYEININNLSSLIRTYQTELSEDDLKEKNYTTVISSNCGPLIDYINKNISEYVSKVLLKIPENKHESEEAFKALLNREDISDSLKEDIIKKLDTRIENLSEIDKEGIKASLLKNLKIEPSWQNILEYYKRLGEACGFNELLVTVLNDEFYYKPLSNELLNNELEDEDFIKKFCRILVYCKDLNLQSFKSLMNSLSYYIDKALDFTNLSKEKVEYLIDLSMLKLTRENFQRLENDQDKFGDLHIKIIKQQFTEFIENYDNYDLNIIDLVKLLESNINDTNEEEKLLKNILEGDYIQQNESLAKIFGKRLCDLDLLERFVIKYFILKVLFDNFIDSSEALENKIKLLNHNFASLADDEIKNLIKTLGNDYKNLFAAETKTISFPNTQFNLDLFKKMKERNLIEKHSSPKQAASDIKVTPSVANT